MTGLFLGALLGTGLFLVWWACWVQPEVPRVGSRGRMLDALRDEIAQAGMTGATPTGVLTVSVVLFAVVFLGFVATVKVVPIAACFGLIAAGLPIVIIRGRARHRRHVLRDLWPDAVDNISSAVRAGLALPEALAQLGVRGPVELRPAFIAFGEDYRATGRFHDCLDRLKERLSDPVADRLIESLRVAREVGGTDLGSLLRTLSSFLREDARTRAELETRQAWTVNAARLAVAAPWIVLAMMTTRPDSMAAYGTVTGVLVLAIGGALTVVAYQLMLRIGRLSEDERVLR
ncbi:type II secretion system F family protein [Kribbia dieselivorans]|uniref:type II secretion system F family protein n=1 Tax=Kribbia dieselivorans TaxID=331526 RepID=UPI000838A0C9|nr:type II secretion system F family protein [Kribbia dieselivorans]